MTTKQKKRVAKILQLSENKLIEAELMKGYIEFYTKDIKDEAEKAKVQLQLQAKQKEIDNTKKFVADFKRYVDTL